MNVIVYILTQDNKNLEQHTQSTRNLPLTVAAAQRFICSDVYSKHVDFILLLFYKFHVLYVNYKVFTVLNLF